MFFCVLCLDQSWGLTSVWPQKATQPSRRTWTMTQRQSDTQPTRAGRLLWPLTTTPWPPQESARSAPPSHTSPIMHSGLWAWSWAGWSWRPTGSREYLRDLFSHLAVRKLSVVCLCIHCIKYSSLSLNTIKINLPVVFPLSDLFDSRLLEQLLEREREYQAILQQVLEEREQEIRLLRLRSEPAGLDCNLIYLFTLTACNSSTTNHWAVTPWADSWSLFIHSWSVINR